MEVLVLAPPAETAVEQENCCIVDHRELIESQKTEWVPPHDMRYNLTAQERQYYYLQSKVLAPLAVPLVHHDHDAANIHPIMRATFSPYSDNYNYYSDLVQGFNTNGINCYYCPANYLFPGTFGCEQPFFRNSAGTTSRAEIMSGGHSFLVPQDSPEKASCATTSSLLSTKAPSGASSSSRDCPVATTWWGKPPALSAGNNATTIGQCRANGNTSASSMIRINANTSTIGMLAHSSSGLSTRARGAVVVELVVREKNDVPTDKW